MRFENTFEVQAPVDEVWTTVLDVERIAPTVPGATVLEQTSENAYKVGIKVKLGPMTMQYKGDIEIVEADEAAHRAVMKARAKESRGQGTADADVTMVLAGEGGRTTGTITTDVKVSGKAASMGRGVMQDVAGRMVGTFSENLAAMLGEGRGGVEEPTPAVEEPVTGEKAAAERVAQASPAPEPPAPEAPKGEDAFDVGALGGQMAAERLRDPRVVGVLLLLAFLLGRRSAR